MSFLLYHFYDKCRLHFGDKIRQSWRSPCPSSMRSSLYTTPQCCCWKSARCHRGTTSTSSAARTAFPKDTPLERYVILSLSLRILRPVKVVLLFKVTSAILSVSFLAQLSIQRAAVWLLDKYYTDFPIYNPYLERLPPRRTRSKLHHSSSFKFYDLDAQQNNGTVQVSKWMGTFWFLECCVSDWIVFH